MCRGAPSLPRGPEGKLPGIVQPPRRRHRRRHHRRCHRRLQWKRGQPLTETGEGGAGLTLAGSFGRKQRKEGESRGSGGIGGIGGSGGSGRRVGEGRGERREGTITRHIGTHAAFPLRSAIDSKPNPHPLARAPAHWSRGALTLAVAAAAARKLADAKVPSSSPFAPVSMRHVVVPHSADTEET